MIRRRSASGADGPAQPSAAALRQCYNMTAWVHSTHPTWFGPSYFAGVLTVAGGAAVGASGSRGMFEGFRNR